MGGGIIHKPETETGAENRVNSLFLQHRVKMSCSEGFLEPYITSVSLKNKPFNH